MKPLHMYPLLKENANHASTYLCTIVPPLPPCEGKTEGRTATGWESLREKAWKDIGGNREEMMSAERFRRYKTEVEENIERRERLAPKNKVESEKHLRDIRGSSEGIGMKTYLHGPIDFAKTLNLRLFVGDLDLPERRKRRVYQ